MVAEGGVNVTTLVLFSLLFQVLSYDILLVEGGYPCHNGGCSTRVDRADEGGLADECVVHFRQDKPEMAVLDPYTGNLDRRRLCGEETMSFLDG